MICKLEVNSRYTNQTILTVKLVILLEEIWHNHLACKSSVEFKLSTLRVFEPFMGLSLIFRSYKFLIFINLIHVYAIYNHRKISTSKLIILFVDACNNSFFVKTFLVKVEPYIDISAIYNYLQPKQLGRRISKQTKSLATICQEVLGISLSKVCNYEISTSWKYLIVYNFVCNLFRNFSAATGRSVL